MKRRYKGAFVYDIETYSNFFCLSACSPDNDDVIQFVIDESTDHREKIVEFFNGIWVIGYNNHRFDDVVINYILSTPGVNVKQIAIFADELIKLGRPEYEDIFYKKFSRYLKSDKYESIDLIRMLFSKKLRVGLKELECSLHHNNVEELPYLPGSTLNKQQKDKVLEYNINDILATKLVLKNSADDLKLRVWAQKSYGVKGYSMDGVALGMKVFEKLLIDRLGNDDFLRTPKKDRSVIKVKDILVPCLKFETPEFQAVLKRYEGLVITSKDLENKEELSNESPFEEEPEDELETVKKFKWEPIIQGHRMKYGIGGLHKDVLKGIWKTTETHRVVSVDVASYYPNIIIKWRKKPEHLPDAFYDVYQLILDERLTAKGKGETLKADTLKLSVNGFFGNTNNRYSWANDLQTTLGTTINGQLMLSMLVERFMMMKFDIIDVNTDGVYIRYPVDQHLEYERIIKEWEQTTQMVLEETEFKEIYFLTTADYFGKPTKGKPKEKGMFIDKVKLGKGMEFPCLPKAIKEYFYTGKDFIQTIKENNDILDFCSYKKLKREYICYWKGIRQQRINRFFASKGGAHLYKRKYNEKTKRMQESHILRDSPVELINKLESKDASNYNINYSFYNAKAREIIYEIEGDKRQVKMFN